MNDIQVLKSQVERKLFCAIASVFTVTVLWHIKDMGTFSCNVDSLGEQKSELHQFSSFHLLALTKVLWLGTWVFHFVSEGLKW